MNFKDIDFKGGHPKFIEECGEDMLEVYYQNNYIIDVGYKEDSDSFFVTIIKNNDWINIHREMEAKTEVEVKNALRKAIDYVSCQA